MKKLMVAMTLLAAFGLTAQADTELGSVNFQDRETGPFDVTVGDDGSSTRLWERSPMDATGDSEILLADDQVNKYLSIEEASPLLRKIKADSVEIPENGGISLASKVQFTAQNWDEADPELETGSKIAVWMKKYGENDDTTNVLVVTANAIVNGQLEVTSSEFEIADLAEYKWYDLEIKAETTVINDQTLTGFIVKFDGVELNKDGELFYSLDQESGAFTTIASIGFKGTGAADDLVFKTYENELPEEPVTVAVSGLELIDLTTLTYQIDANEPVEFKDDLAFEFKMSEVKETLKIHAEAAGYENYDATYTATQLAEMVSDDMIEITVEMKESGEEEDWPTPADVADKTAEQVYVELGIIIPEALKSANAGLISAWATKNGVTFESGAAIDEEAFLLDCAPAEVEAKKAEALAKLKITSIECIGGEWVVKCEIGTDGAEFNANSIIKKVDVTEQFGADKADATKGFFKLMLAPKGPIAE